MNRQIRIVAWVMLAALGALFVNLTLIQVVNARKLAENPANTRILLREHSIERGSMLASGGEELARSVSTPKDALKYLREYPSGAAFSHITGHYSVRFGRTGLESSYNSRLLGSGGVLSIQDIGDKIGGGERGDDVVLSILAPLQAVAAEGVGPRRGAVVAMDPLTGQILAMYSSPGYDPNQLSAHSSKTQQTAWDKLRADPAKPLLSRATNFTYPPGSTFKLITAAAALRNGATLEKSFEAAKEFRPLGTDKTIGNFGGATCGGSMIDAMRASCNTYFARLGAELPQGVLLETARAFGFESSVPIDTRAAVSRMPSPANLRTQAFAAQSSIGQFDVAATPLQMAGVASTIANRGSRVSLRLMQEIRDQSGNILEQGKTVAVGPAVEPNVAADLTKMMIEVVKSGTGRAASLPGVDVAGKTGTAQTGADGKSSVAWFIGFAPAGAPRIALAVAIESDEDSSNETGGRTAAPIAKAIFERHRELVKW